MNRSGSHPKHENRDITILTVLIHRTVSPFVAGGVYQFWGCGVSQPPISESKRRHCNGNPLFKSDDSPLAQALPPLGAFGACDASALPVKFYTNVYR